MPDRSEAARAKTLWWLNGEVLVRELEEALFYREFLCIMSKINASAAIARWYTKKIKLQGDCSVANELKKKTKPDMAEHSTSVVDAFSIRLREWRATQGFPLKRVAKDLGVSISIVSEWEHGHRFPSVSNLEAVSRYVGLPVCCLLFHGRGHCPHMRCDPT